VRIPSAIFRYVELELYHYDATRRDLEEMRDDLLNETPHQEVRVSGGHTSDTTRARATKLLTSAAINDMTRVVNAIDTALGRLTEEHRPVCQRHTDCARGWLRWWR
jgi:predicted phage gp36 major capsid-like protein